MLFIITDELKVLAKRQVTWTTKIRLDCVPELRHKQRGITV